MRLEDIKAKYGPYGPLVRFEKRGKRQYESGLENLSLMANLNNELQTKLNKRLYEFLMPRLVCRMCGMSQHPSSARFCGMCGTPLDPVQVSQENPYTIFISLDEFLTTHNLHSYKTILQEEGVDDLDTLNEYTEDELIAELGFKIGSAKKVRRLLKKMFPDDVRGVATKTLKYRRHPDITPYRIYLSELLDFLIRLPNDIIDTRGATFILASCRGICFPELGLGYSERQLEEEIYHPGGILVFDERREFEIKKLMILTKKQLVTNIRAMKRLGQIDMTDEFNRSFLRHKDTALVKFNKRRLINFILKNNLQTHSEFDLPVGHPSGALDVGLFRQVSDEAQQQAFDLQRMTRRETADARPPKSPPSQQGGKFRFKSKKRTKSKNSKKSRKRTKSLTI